MQKSRRSRNIIDAEVQYSLLRTIAIHWGLFLIANSLAMMFWIRLFDDPTGTWSDTFSQFSHQFLPFLLVSFALLPVFLLDTAKLSNRFAGPIVRIRRTLEQIAEGGIVKPLSFRQGDFWQSLATDFNRVFQIRAQANPESPSANGGSNTNHPESY